MMFCLIVQLWNTNTQAIVSYGADLTENYMFISMKFRTGVHVFAGKLVYLIVLTSVHLAVMLPIALLLIGYQTSRLKNVLPQKKKKKSRNQNHILTFHKYKRCL